MPDLPVSGVLPALAAALKEHASAVLCAAPGAGKTTLVPPYLLKHLFSSGGKIIMLEPRRIAARASAVRIALLLGEKAGRTVGYRTHLDTKVSAETRIEIVTEGILTRMLQQDPSLDGVQAVIFDEFHERSIHADLALALTMESVSVLRPDLKILVMSATLDADRVSALLGNAPVLRSEGRVFPVQTFYRPRLPDKRIEDSVSSAVLSAVHSGAPGDILVFLPGEGEIRRTLALLQHTGEEDFSVLPLYGALPPDQQDLALMPDARGRRKVILSTSIAETSLTIEGVATVIDSGLMRVPRFSPRNGMNRLETVRVSRASADQRRGRAGRTMPGVCIRLWSEAEEQRFSDFAVPEILESDLAPLLLELARWGVKPEEIVSLHWMDPPPKAGLRQAAALLHSLGALDPEGRITAHGRELAQLPMHPRLAHAARMAEALGDASTACLLGSLLEERDLTQGRTCDLAESLRILKRGDPPPAVRRIREGAGQTARLLRIPLTEPDPDAAGLILAFAYPDRIGFSRARQSGEYVLSNGTGARLKVLDHLASSEFIVCADVEGEGARQIIFSAAAVSERLLRENLPELFHTEVTTAWDPEKKCVTARQTEFLGELRLSGKDVRGRIPEAQLARAFLDGIRQEGISAVPFGKAARALRERVAFVRHHLPEKEFPDLSDEALTAQLETWMGPHAGSFTRLSQLENGVADSLLENLLTFEQKTELKRLAPERITVPTGTRAAVDYSSPDHVPFLSVRLQELFGLAETPRIAGGRVPVTIHMLSPAMRPVQITNDLHSFWTESYFLVRKDLRGRYPKHYWPENPLEAEPTRRARRPGEKQP